MREIGPVWHGFCIIKGMQPKKNYTHEEALELATEWGLYNEVKYEMEHGCTPNEALYEWDLLEFDI